MLDIPKKKKRGRTELTNTFIYKVRFLVVSSSFECSKKKNYASQKVEIPLKWLLIAFPFSTTKARVSFRNWASYASHRYVQFSENMCAQ